MYRTGGYWFPWKTLSFLLLIGSAAIINLDVKKNGTFSSSHTGHFLKDLGKPGLEEPSPPLILDTSSRI